MHVLCENFKTSIMSISSTKKINKLKTNKIVRETINLNKSDILFTKIDKSFNCIDESNRVSQLPEINLTNQFNTQKLTKNGQLVFK
jgi:hypothetical protein